MRCVKALTPERALLPNLRVLVVDGGSGDGSAAKLARGLAGRAYRAWVSFLPLEINGGYGWSNNQGILTLSRDEHPPEFIHILNPDAEVTKGAVASLVRELQEHSRCGAAGSQLLNPDGRNAASAFRFPSGGREFINAAQSQRLGRMMGIGSTVFETPASAEVDWVTGASVMFRSAALRETGLFDDGFFLYFEEVELMHRMKERGWSIRHVPDSRVVHAEGSSTGLGGATIRPLPDYWYRSRLRYFARTGGSMSPTLANLAWMAGRGVALAKSVAGIRKRPAAQRIGDMLRTGSWPRRKDRHGSISEWGDAPGRPPAWMARS